MTDKLPDVWTTRDFPVLVEVARRIDSGEHFVEVESVADALNMELKQVRLASAALTRMRLVQTSSSIGGDDSFEDISGEAYVLVGLRPNGEDAAASLVDALRQAAELVDDEDERGRLKQAASRLLDVSQGVLGGVLTAWVTSQIPQ